MSRWTVIATVVAMLAGCASATMPRMDVRSEFDPGAAPVLGAYKTYGWLPHRPGAETRLDAAQVAPVVSTAVDEALGAKGYRQGVPAPDFLVGWHVTMEGKQRTTKIDSSYGYDRYNVPGRSPSAMPISVVQEYEEGALILDIVDAKSKTLIWRGSAQAEVKGSVDPETRAARIREAVRQILKSFPPKS